MRTSRDNSVWRSEPSSGGFSCVRNTSRQSVNESPIRGAWLHHSHTTRLSSSGQSVCAGLRLAEGRIPDPKSNQSRQELGKSSQSESHSGHGYHMPRSASATTVSAMTVCGSRARPVGSDTSWPTETTTNEEWQKPESARSFASQLATSNANPLLFHKDDLESSSSSGMPWWLGSQQLSVTGDTRRPEATSWNNLNLKPDPSSMNRLSQATAVTTTLSSVTKLPQFLDLDTRTLSNRVWNPGDNRALFDDKPPPPRRRCNAPLNLDLSGISQPDQSTRPGGSHLGLVTESHLAGVSCVTSSSSGQASLPPSRSQTREDAFRPHPGFPLAIHPSMGSHPAVAPPPILGNNQYSPVTPAPGSATLINEQKMEQPMAFTFPPAEPFHTTNNTSYSVDPHGPSSMKITTEYCTSPPARLPSVLESTGMSNKGMNTTEREACLKHSNSSGKLEPFLTRWHSDSSRPVSAHGSSSGYGHNVYRLNEPWSERTLASGSNDLESMSGSTGTPNSHGDVLFAALPTNEPATHPNEQQLYCPRPRYSSNQTSDSKLTEERAGFTQPYAPSFGPIPPPHRHAFNNDGSSSSDEKGPIRTRPYPAITESSSSAALLHPFSTLTNPNLNHPQHHQQQQQHRPAAPEEPERTRHTSAPFLSPVDHHSDPNMGSFLASSVGPASRGYSDTP
ncbi:unnamed protein product, partial [Echinostoma caproni]|uniref:Protein kinase domain-containing protein n=1 Tax=Echinostoma caproni TaxID=27848 RepID=A0A183B2V9_9TREM